MQILRHITLYGLASFVTKLWEETFFLILLEQVMENELLQNAMIYAGINFYYVNHFISLHCNSISLHMIALFILTSLVGTMWYKF